MKRIVQVRISRGENCYVAEGTDVPFVTQAKTLDELVKNIQEAVALTLEGEDLSMFDLDPNASVLVNFELPAAANA